jgi:hypothetical protein
MELTPILTARPEGMSFEEYKAIRKQQQKEIKNYLRGDFAFKSKNKLNVDKEGKEIKGLTAERIKK